VLVVGATVVEEEVVVDRVEDEVVVDPAGSPGMSPGLVLLVVEPVVVVVVP
jgi:hypothetical protein